MPTYRFCRTSVLFAIVISVFLPGTTAHATPNTLFEVIVTCPPFWPGTDAPGLPREKILPEVSDGPYMAMMTEDDGSNTLGDRGELMLDCHYKGDRRLTISVPEADTKCYYKHIPGMPNIKDLVCTAIANHTLPVTTQIAEHVTVQTTFAGFGLRQPLDAITALAEKKSLHFEVIYDSEKVPIRVIITGNGGELTTITLSRRTGLSREILLSWPWDTGEDQGSLFYSTVVRFGFRRNTSWVINRSWTSADKQAFLTLVRRGPMEHSKQFPELLVYNGPYDLRLTDLQTSD